MASDGLIFRAPATIPRIAGLVLIDNSIGEGAPPPPRASNVFQNLRRDRDRTMRGFVASMYRTPQSATYLDRLARDAQRMAVEAARFKRSLEHFMMQRARWA